ncbi:hypothetical protein [Albibacterium sp.]|uniref:hypothetical protein n=1 Tax=Albibacterium sp. TaxID=2952885 RepID=UPI002CCC607E|nr:hypothetical protein [Albibacterium sp.]HUH18114.1 hypothetical protein [Albibacterium sp.]
MIKKYNTLLIILTSMLFFSCASNSVTIQDGDYPEGAEQVQFKEIGQSLDSLKLIAEIDIFDGSKIPVGVIVDMEEIGDMLYFADSKQSVIHVIDKETLKYKTSIGGPGPDQLFKIFSLYVSDNNLLVGNSQGPNLLKTFSSNGDFLMSYPNNDPPLWFISMNINDSFISDSVAYVTNMFADKGRKIIRYDLRGGEANKIDEIVPVTDLHAELDSAISAKIITNMSVLKSNVLDSLFYVLPTNKYLINSYNMKGEKVSSIDLRGGIPQINKAYLIMKKLPFSSLFMSAVIDDRDNIYFHIAEFEGVEVDDSADVMDAKIANTKAKLNLVSVNLMDKTYRIFKTESRSVSPLKIIDDKLWCFDSMNSQLLVYQFPNK